MSSCEPAGKSEFDRWLAQGNHRNEAAAFDRFLKREKADKVIPLMQLLRSDTQWRRCGAEPFEIPPEKMWSNIVPTLKLVQTQVKPVLGSVEAVSVFRSPSINSCIHGASRSYHLHFHAIDMRPPSPVSRAELINKLCDLHRRKGQKLKMGLGIYKGTRFHIDTAGYRRWGHDYHAATSPCESQ